MQVMIDLKEVREKTEADYMDVNVNFMAWRVLGPLGTEDTNFMPMSRDDAGGASRQDKCASEAEPAAWQTPVRPQSRQDQRDQAQARSESGADVSSEAAGLALRECHEVASRALGVKLKGTALRLDRLRQLYELEDNPELKLMYKLKWKVALMQDEPTYAATLREVSTVVEEPEMPHPVPPRQAAPREPARARSPNRDEGDTQGGCGGGGLFGEDDADAAGDAHSGGEEGLEDDHQPHEHGVSPTHTPLSSLQDGEDLD